MGKVENQIKKIFRGGPPGHPHPSRNERAILLLAQEMDMQNEDMKAAYDTAKQILVAIDELDKKFLKAGI